MGVLRASEPRGPLLPGVLPSGWQRLRLWGKTGWCALLMLLSVSTSQAQSKEYQIKAAFLFNFAQFVLWPATAFTNTSEPFQIGVLGDNPFGKALEEIVRGETIQSRPIVIVQSSSVEKLAGCQVLFVSKSEAAHLKDVFTKLDSKPVLTVSEDPAFISHGGMINFYREGPKVRFEINSDAAARNGLKLSSELLRVGKIVHTETPDK
ncbi:MAG TPA: YfiR family protein [Verrucomicrobiae bacterium]|jgi:hypothetical protein|nr:YfiR family protein [Verrucomicrobiae bacterium]